MDTLIPSSDMFRTRASRSGVPLALLRRIATSTQSSRPFRRPPFSASYGWSMGHSTPVVKLDACCAQPSRPASHGRSLEEAYGLLTGAEPTASWTFAVGRFWGDLLTPSFKRHRATTGPGSASRRGACAPVIARVRVLNVRSMSAAACADPASAGPTARRRQVGHKHRGNWMPGATALGVELGRSSL
jgi:hypothetical protein